VPVGDASPYGLTPLDPPLRIAVVRSVALIVIGRLWSSASTGVTPGPEEVQAITSRVNYAGVLDPPSPVVSRLLTAYMCPVCPVIFWGHRIEIIGCI